MIALAIATAAIGPPAVAAACPFCNADKPTLAQERQAAAVVALGEALEANGRGAESCRFRIHSVLKGSGALDGKQSIRVATDLPLAAGSLVLLLGDGEDWASTEEWSWEIIEVDETAIGYFVRSPSLRRDGSERLKYFARYLEHPNPLIAEDAYLEFAHAPFDVVAGAADRLPIESIRGWIEDAAVPDARKGFYGLTLGLSEDPRQRAANIRLLHRLILEPAVDFRSGFDGILGGCLLAEGEPALELIEKRILADPLSAEGDVRHALNALRFIHESGGNIRPERLCTAVRNLLARREFAAAAIVDLARWRDWDALKRIVSLYDGPATEHLETTRRAIVGYLLVCPGEDAVAGLERIRRLDPKMVADAESRPFLPSR